MAAGQQTAVLTLSAPSCTQTSSNCSHALVARVRIRSPLHPFTRQVGARRRCRLTPVWRCGPSGGSDLVDWAKQWYAERDITDSTALPSRGGSEDDEPALFVKWARNAKAAEHELGLLSDPSLLRQQVTSKPYGRFELNGQHFLVLGYAGQRLSDLVDTHPELLVQAVDVLGKLLSSGVLNCDLKPGHFYARPLDDGTFQVSIVDFDMGTKAGFPHPMFLPPITYDYVGALPRDILLGRFVGTAAFASINAHLGFLPSLATELENGVYVLLSLAKMRMPWLVAEVAEAFARSCPSSAKQVNLYLQAKLFWLFSLPATYPQVGQGKKKRTPLAAEVVGKMPNGFSPATIRQRLGSLIRSVHTVDEAQQTADTLAYLRTLLLAYVEQKGAQLPRQAPALDLGAVQDGIGAALRQRQADGRASTPRPGASPSREQSQKEPGEERRQRSLAQAQRATGALAQLLIGLPASKDATSTNPRAKAVRAVSGELDVYGRLGESLPVLMRDLRPRRLLVNWDKAAGMEEARQVFPVKEEIEKGLKVKSAQFSLLSRGPEAGSDEPKALQVIGRLPDPLGGKWLVVGEAASLANEEGFEGKLAQLEAHLAHVQGQQSPADSALHPLDLLDVKVYGIMVQGGFVAMSASTVTDRLINRGLLYPRLLVLSFAQRLAWILINHEERIDDPRRHARVDARYTETALAVDELKKELSSLRQDNEAKLSSLRQDNEAMRQDNEAKLSSLQKQIAMVLKMVKDSNRNGGTEKSS